MRLRTHILRMNEHLRGHLDEEDVIYPAALRDNVKEKVGSGSAQERARYI